MREMELRLALICYGGISLAVYMHGITKEVWHLVRASRAAHDGTPPANALEEVYADLLARIEAASGTRVRVLADILAGASAGGINAVFLAQAIASGQSLDPLTALWLDHADVEALLDRDSRAPSRFSRLWAGPLARAFAGRQEALRDEEADPAVREEIDDKLTRLVRARWFEPPFGGANFDRLLLSAFDAMRVGPSGARLLPAEQPLDLFVSVTDFTGHPEALPLHSPPSIVENEHRLTLSFRDAPGDDTALGHVAGLVLAARATASFPGAFAPFKVAELDRVLAEDARGWPGRDDFLARILPRQASVGAAERTVLIDGSVLANAPFRPAIEALRDRPARRAVDRRFVYIDPKPGSRAVKLTAGRNGDVPGFFTTLFAALSDIPREQPIRDNLEAIAAHSARVERTRGIVANLRPQVEAAVEALFGRTMFLDRPTAARLGSWRIRAETTALTQAGFGALAYRALVRATIVDAAARASDQPRAALESQIATMTDIGALDLATRIRRLRFVARRLAAEGEAAFEPVLAAVYASLAAYIERQSSRFGGTIVASDPADVPDLLARRWNLRALDGATDAALATAIAGLPRERRREPLFAYLGFAFYDVATYALLQGEGFDEFDPVKVDRIAPDDARSLAGDSPPLKGIQFNNFGAFFARAYRENDYLWGRLHGAERMIDIVASTVPPGSLSPGEVVAIKSAVFTAIVDSEALRLTHIAPLIATLRQRIAAMAGNAGAGGID